MYTANIVAPATSRGAPLTRATNPGPPTIARYRRRRLLQVLAGPANTPSVGRPRRPGRHYRSTDATSRSDHR